MDVDVFNEKGKSIKNKKGELVCKNLISINATKILE